MSDKIKQLEERVAQDLVNVEQAFKRQRRQQTPSSYFYLLLARATLENSRTFLRNEIRKAGGAV